MIQIRRNVFETNSSSTHSLSMTSTYINDVEFDQSVFEKEYIIKQAELTEEESAAFFPLYFELQSKKHEANRSVWKQARAVAPHERTEEECVEMIDALADVKIACALLEKDYLQRFKEILPAKKLMRVQMAEERYQRELLKGMQQGPRPGAGQGKRPGAPRP